MNGNIEDIIESKIEKIVSKNNVYHSGKVSRINSFVIEATGLEDAFFFEMVYIGTEENIGYVDKIEENKTIIAVVKTNNQIKIGDAIKTTGQALQSSFSKEAMGMVVDAFGTDRFSNKNFKERKMIAIETPKIPIMDRTSVNRPLETGISGIDMMFPIGKGQRQLIIGDKKTGKTQILLDTIVNQKDKNVICIYVSIGKTKKDIKRIFTKLVEKGANEYTQIISAFNDDPSPLIKLTPYVALSIAEEYMREGRDVLVCIDDLKKHADACRAIPLIAEKNTGREWYPADIFYTHSRLLEKGCQYKNGGSITILPVVETKGGDITDYVSTNIISITDGQIVLNEKNFKKGQKPAIDFGLSVSRLGGAVQKPSIKTLGAKVRRELLSYLETADVYQLVKIDAMSAELQEKMILGQKILSLLKQQKFSPRSEEKLIEMFSFIEQKEILRSSSENDEQVPIPTTELIAEEVSKNDLEKTDIKIENTKEKQLENETKSVTKEIVEENEYEETGNTEMLDVVIDQDQPTATEVSVPVMEPLIEKTTTQSEYEEAGNTEMLDVVIDQEQPTITEASVPVMKPLIEKTTTQSEYQETGNTEMLDVVVNQERPTITELNDAKIETMAEIQTNIPTIEPILEITNIVSQPTEQSVVDSTEPAIVSSEPIIVSATTLSEKQEEEK